MDIPNENECLIFIYIADAMSSTTVLMSWSHQEPTLSSVFPSTGTFMTKSV